MTSIKKVGNFVAQCFVLCMCYGIYLKCFYFILSDCLSCVSEIANLLLQARSWSLEGSLKLKNLFGYGDIWDGSGAIGWDQTSEISAGMSLPRFKGLVTPLVARISLLSQDWLKFSSYKERLLGLSVGLVSTRHHDLAYNLTWRTLSDQSQMSSRSIRRQLGHNVLSSLKYSFKIDRRNSPLRPTRGYAFLSTSQIGGLTPDSRSLRFLRQVQCSFPIHCSFFFFLHN